MQTSERTRDTFYLKFLTILSEKKLQKEWYIQKLGPKNQNFRSNPKTETQDPCKR